MKNLTKAKLKQLTVESNNQSYYTQWLKNAAHTRLTISVRDKERL